MKKAPPKQPTHNRAEVNLLTELAQRCAKVSPSTKVMFITGFAAVTMKASREAPQARVLSKPFHLRDLVLEVERLFDDNVASIER